MDRDAFKHITQKFDNKVWNLVNQKGFYLYKYIIGFEKFKEVFPGKEKFYDSLAGKQISDSDCDHILNV